MMQLQMNNVCQMTVKQARRHMVVNAAPHFSEKEVDRMLSHRGKDFSRESLMAALLQIGFRAVDRNTMLRVFRLNDGSRDVSTAVSVVDRHPAYDTPGPFIVVAEKGMELTWMLEEWSKAIKDINEFDAANPGRAL